MFSKTSFSYLFLILISGICFSRNYEGIESYVQMITDNLLAISEFVSPVDNEALVNLTDYNIYVKLSHSPRRKVIGGSGTINAKMYVRGNKEDYDTWVQMGNPGWSYQEVLPYFIKSENCHIPNVDTGYHGKNGELNISTVEKTVFGDIFLEAGPEVGLNVVEDYNGKDQIGVSTIQYTIQGNRTVTTGSAFLDPIRNRPNLNISIKSYVTKVLIDSTTKLAYGVEFIKNGTQYRATASKEVLIAGGAFNTPQLLMLSGIGPAEELKKLGIDPIVDLPVGKYMQDHPLFLGLLIRTNQTLFNVTLETEVQNYFDNHRPLTAPFNVENMAFINVSDPNNDVPNIQFIQNIPNGMDMSVSGLFNFQDEIRLQIYNNYNRYSDIFNFVMHLHPKSRGSITLKSNNPIDFPNIDYNFFSDPNNEDIEVLYQGIVAAINLVETDAYKALNASVVNVAEYCGANNTASNREYWYCAIKHLTMSLFHPVGTTRMGTSSNDSVVSSDLIVHGIKNLRVIDGSIMPEITSGNTVAPIFMIGEKMADVIKDFYNVSTYYY